MVDGHLSSTYLRYTNYSHIEEQNEERTRQLSGKIDELKYIALEIRDETKRQNDDFTV